MTKSFELIVPALGHFVAPAKVRQWYTTPGQVIAPLDRVLTLTDGVSAVYHVTTPAVESVLQRITLYADDAAPTGSIVGILDVPDDYTDTTERDWDKFDQLSDILLMSTDMIKDAKGLKDTSEALSEILGIKEDAVFQRMNTDQQNQFLQSVVDQYETKGLSPAVMAQKLLEGLQLRTPQLAPATPAPVFGLRPSAPGMGGMGGPGGQGGGGGTRPQQPIAPPTMIDEE